MRKLLVLSGIMLLSATAQADVLKTEFTTKYIFLGPGKGAFDYNAPSPATLTLTLNDNGTVAANLAVEEGFSWKGIALNSAPSFGYLQSSIWISAGAVSVARWSTPFGFLTTGLYCSKTCSGPASWVIGNVGQFTSARQVVGGQALTDAFFMSGAGGQYGGMVFSPPNDTIPSEPSRVPEPASISLFGAALMSLAIARRRIASHT